MKYNFISEPFHEDYLNWYSYDKETNEVYVYPKQPYSNLEASVLMDVVLELAKQLISAINGDFLIVHQER